MSRSLGIALCIFICSIAKAQTLTHSVNYGIGYKLLLETQLSESYFQNKGRLVFNDTLSFYFQTLYRQDERGKTIAVKRNFNHSYYRNKSQDFSAEGASYNLKKRVFITPELKNKWQLIPGEKMVAGYNCLVALSVGNQNDSTFAYYSKELPSQFGPEFYGGLPGTILEIFDKKNNKNIVAIQVSNGEYNFKLPEGILTMSPKEFRNNTAIRRKQL